MIEAPPDYVIEAARAAGIQSPCAKSKRGVVLFNADNAARRAKHPDLRIADAAVIVARGFNGPPRGFDCANTMVCRGWCREVCLHAEQRAIIAAVGCDDVVGLELVHVKVVDGQVVAGGGPSCLQCSRLVVDVGLRGVWLFEANPVEGKWRFYSAAAFHEATLANNGISSLGVGA